MKPLRWCLVRRKRVALTLIGVPLVLLNVVAYRQAHAFLHYVPGAVPSGAANAQGRWDKLRVLFAGITVPRPENRYTPADLRLRYTTHAIDANGVRLEAWHVPVSRSRGLVLLFHGYGMCKAALLTEAAAFHDMGYATLLVDFRGSGGSSESDTTIGVREADDVAAAVVYAREQWPAERLILYGQSMGATAILRAAALDGVEPDAVVLECPFDRLLTTVEHRFEAMNLPTFPLARLLCFWGGLQSGFDAFTHNPVEFAAHVHCPALLMHGALDWRVRTPEAEAIEAALAGPKRFEVFAEAGHQSYCRKSRGRWCEIVAEFLTEELRPE